VADPGAQVLAAPLAGGDGAALPAVGAVVADGAVLPVVADGAVPPAVGEVVSTARETVASVGTSDLATLGLGTAYTCVARVGRPAGAALTAAGTGR
jgi:hypothetical protein